MINAKMEMMVRDLISTLRSNRPAERVLILARSASEMLAIAKYADDVLKRAEYFCRSAYEGDKRYLFHLSFPIPETDDFADLWVANIHEATPDAMAYFADGGAVTDHVAWPDEEGLYVLVPYARWGETWYPGRREGWERDRPYPNPYFRPADVEYALRYEVGRPIGWVPPGRKVSVWEHLRRNLSINIEDGKEVTTMPAKKKAAKAKAKAKIKSPKKANKTAKKPA